MKKYNNEVLNVAKLTKFEVAFLTAMAEEAQRVYNDTKNDREELSDVAKNLIDVIKFDMFCIDEEVANYYIGIAKQIEKIFANQINTMTESVVAEDIICDMFWDTDYTKYNMGWTKEQEEFVKNKQIAVPVIDFVDGSVRICG